MKITNFKKAIGCLAVAAILFSAIPVYARGPEGKGYEDERCSHEQKDEIKKAKENLVKELGLTPEQEEQLKRQRQEHGEQMKGLAVKMRAKQKELRLELEKYDSDEDKINSLVSELKSAQAQLVDLRVARIASIKSILTQEQYERFNEKIRSRFDKEAKGKFWKRTKGRSKER